MRIQPALIAFLLSTASAAAQSQPAPPPIPGQTASGAATPVPSEVVEFCDFAPVEIGTKCFEALNGWEQSGVDPTLSARSIKPADGDTILVSPDWSAALIIRETVRGIRTAAWPNGKSSKWLADVYSDDLVIAHAEGVVNTDPKETATVVTEVNVDEAKPVATEPAPATNPDPANASPKLTEGWIVDVENDQGISLATYYDDDGSWFQSDASAVMPVDDASDEFTFVRTAKMIIPEDGEYTFGIMVTAPDFNEVTAEMAKTSFWDNYIRDLNQSMVCAVEFNVNGSPIIKKTGELALVKASRLDFTGISAGIEKGVYDAKIIADCNWTNERIQASRRALQKHNGADQTAMSPGFEFTAMSEQGRVRFAVETDDLINVYKAANTPAKMLSPAPALPEGYASGWVIERHPSDREKTWPISMGTYQAVSRSDEMSVGEYDFARNKKGALVVKTLYTPEYSGTHTFAVAPSLSTITTDDTNDDQPLAWEQEVVFRVEDIIFPTQPIRAYRSNLEGIGQFGHAVGVSAVEADLEAGVTYNVGIYLPNRNPRYRSCSGPRGCWILYRETDKDGNRLPGDSLRFLIRTPSDPGLRGFEATEALHKVADTDGGQG